MCNLRYQLFEAASYNSDSDLMWKIKKQGEHCSCFCFPAPASFTVAEGYSLIYWSASILGCLWRRRKTGGQMEDKTKGKKKLCSQTDCLFLDSERQMKSSVLTPASSEMLSDLSLVLNSTGLVSQRSAPPSNVSFHSQRFCPGTDVGGKCGDRLEQGLNLNTVNQRERLCEWILFWQTKRGDFKRKY